MKKKVALVAFNGEAMCFVHVLLNALDMDSKGYDVKLIIEGSACKLVSTMTDEKQPFSQLYTKVKDKSLITCVCQACAAKMGSLDNAKEQGLTISGDMMGHPSLAQYIEDGYQIITF
jgi:hypothetical protein